MLEPAPERATGLAALLMRFGLAGAVNTGVGFAVIEGLELGFHVPSAIANAGGYALGFGIGFLLSRGFVFRSSERGALPRYLVAIAFAFVLNQAVLAGLRLVAGDAPLARTLAQLAAMAAYTATSFVLCRYWVFAAPGKTISRT